MELDEVTGVEEVPPERDGSDVASKGSEESPDESRTIVPTEEGTLS